MKLLNSTKIGKFTLKNSMVMSPMTRSRADENGIVSDLTVLYYTQRASAGLIISEGINISEEALGSPWTPGIYLPEQIEAWKRVTKAVHENGGVIYAQLWHTGRVGHSIDKNGKLPVAPSAIAISDQNHFTSQGRKDYEIPKELNKSEIKEIISDYRQAAINAIEAGFDGVELHAGFGYLPNQFLSESANKRTDEYGGSVENRNRFVLKIVKEIVEAIGSEKIGVRLSPTNTFNNIENSDPKTQFVSLIKELNEFPLSYIHLANAIAPLDKYPHYPKNVMDTFGVVSKHPVIANSGYDRESGEAELAKGIAQLISYGALFLANPDLPKRFELGAELNPPDRDTMFGGGVQGYTDYPFLQD
ncbi:alkene reductase [Sphingobacterium sp. HSC-15S19]|uniref:alkene reductase n=1 Tax=Sphingobacterium TaxID=28453 RepID=UPI003D1AEB0D